MDLIGVECVCTDFYNGLIAMLFCREWDSETVKQWDSETVKQWDSATVRQWNS
jgi:hypothetical protein